MHTTSTAATRKDPFDYPEQNPGGLPSISHLKSFHSLEKATFRFRNQSQSTVGTVRGPGAGSVRSYTATSTSEQEIRSLNTPSFEGEDEYPLPSETTPRSSLYDPSTLAEPGPSSSRIHGVPPSTPLDDLSTEPYGDSRPFATTEIPTADNPPANHPSSLPPPRDRRMDTVSLSHTVPSTKETPFVSGTATNHKVYGTSSPSAPSSRRTPKKTVEYIKPSKESIKEYERLLRESEVYTTASKDPFVPSTQTPLPSPHNVLNPSRSQQKAAPFVPLTPPHPSQKSQDSPTDFYADPIPIAVPGTAPTAPLGSLPEVSVSPTQADSMGINSRTRGGSVAAKGKKGVLGIMTDLLKSHKRPEISTAYDPVHLTHVGFNSSTGEFTGLPKEWPQLLQDSRISKSDQEKKKEGKGKDADMVKRLQQICSDGDSRLLYRNLVKIGPG